MRRALILGAMAFGTLAATACGDDTADGAGGGGSGSGSDTSATGATAATGSPGSTGGGDGGGDGAGGPGGGDGSGGDGSGGDGSGGDGSGGGEALPPNPGPDGLYLGSQGYDVRVPPKAEPIFWGAAPAIDPQYGGVLYAGTDDEMPDPRPDLVGGDDQPLRAWVADPNNGLVDRPAIVWVHGGGFAVGIDSMHGLANTDGRAYADRGYVGFSLEYRIDTTVIGGKSLCQWVQDNEAPGDPTWEERKDKCVENIIAAQRDALAFVRWLRSHAAEYGVDPTKIAVGGFSAGAVTASNTAYQGDDVGDVAYFEGDDISVEASRVQAAFGASGCTYSEDGGAPPTIGAGDAPVSLIHSELDLAVPYACAALTVETARAAGLVAELTSYCDQGGHADDLYEDHLTATDVQWTTFLTREMRIYSGMAAASEDPTCD